MGGGVAKPHPEPQASPRRQEEKVMWGIICGVPQAPAQPPLLHWPAGQRVGDRFEIAPKVRA